MSPVGGHGIRTSYARRATARSYVRSSPITPTLCTGSKITPACHTWW